MISIVNPIYLWLVIMLLCIIIEFFMMDFFLLCFALAAGVTALIIRIATINLYWQIGVFCAISILAFFFIRPFFQKLLLLQRDKKKLGIEAYIDNIYMVTEDIDNLQNTGKVKIGSEIWRAHSLNDEKISTSSRVKVKKIEGSTLFVEKE